jgi:PAS domain S-box-containing protein
MLELVAHAPIVMLATRDRDHRCAVVSESARALAQPRDPIGLPFAQAFPILGEHGWGALLDRAFSRGEPYAAKELSVALDPSTERCFDLTIHPLRGPASDVEGLLLYAVDVSERVHAHQLAEAFGRRLEDQQRLVQTISDNTPSLLFIFDPDGRGMFVNTAVERVTGYRRDELLGEVLHDRLHRVYPDGRPFPVEECSLAQTRQLLEAIRGREDTFVRKDGSTFPVLYTASPITENGEHVGTVVQALDLTELKQAEERARERLTFLAEASAVLAGSLDYAITLASIARLAVPYLSDWCNVDLVEPDGSIQRVATVHRDPKRQKLAERLRKRYPRLTLDDRHTLVDVLRSGQPWIDSNVSPVRLAAQARDAEHLELIRGLGFASEMVVPLVARERALGTITLVRTDPAQSYGPDDLALAEELARRVALAIDNARLHREVQEQMASLAELNAELRETATARDQAVVELERALRTRDDFLGAAAHDLRTPLAAIQGQAQLLRRRAARSGTAEADATVGGLLKIEASVGRMTAMINELIDLTRLQFGQSLPLDHESVELVGLVRQVAAEWQQTTERHQLKVETDLPTLYGEWDQVRLERVLANLVDNAIKYSPNGGEIGLTVMTENNGTGDWAVVSVRDQGLGIPATALPRLFERFHRAENVVGRIGGTGIGLALARHTIESHGGTIAVESQETVGSTFTIRLPLAAESAHLGTVLDEPLRR